MTRPKARTFWAELRRQEGMPLVGWLYRTEQDANAWRNRGSRVVRVSVTELHPRKKARRG